MLRFRLTLLLVFLTITSQAASILISMGEEQKNHLKAYGIAFSALKAGQEVEWLLNYQGGSFMFKYTQLIENECKIRGVSYETISDAQSASIFSQISDPETNMDVVKLEKAPKIAVYSPKNILPNAESDAVVIVLEYAEIPFDIVYDEEIVKGDLPKYDWIHLHHEDFTGHFGREPRGYENRSIQEMMAKKLGFDKVTQMKMAVAQKIREFVAGGGFLFAMCSAADTFDIALASEGIDIAASNIDGDPMDPNAQAKLDFKKSFAFENFTIAREGGSREFSDINTGNSQSYGNNFFTLFSFSAKWDPVPTMLTQDHDHVIKGFNGKTTAFRKSLVKPNVLIMGEDKAEGVARYIHGEYGNGQWTFYGGHDPESNQGGGRGGGGNFGGGGFGGGGFGGGGNRGTDLSLYPHSPGYRLILNNVLFPAAKKKKLKT